MKSDQIEEVVSSTKEKFNIDPALKWFDFGKNENITHLIGGKGRKNKIVFHINLETNKINNLLKLKEKNLFYLSHLKKDNFILLCYKKFSFDFFNSQSRKSAKKIKHKGFVNFASVRKNLLFILSQEVINIYQINKTIIDLKFVSFIKLKVSNHNNHFKTFFKYANDKYYLTSTNYYSKITEMKLKNLHD